MFKQVPNLIHQQHSLCFIHTQALLYPKTNFGVSEMKGIPTKLWNATRKQNISDRRRLKLVRDTCRCIGIQSVTKKKKKAAGIQLMSFRLKESWLADWLWEFFLFCFLMSSLLEFLSDPQCEHLNWVKYSTCVCYTFHSWTQTCWIGPFTKSATCSPPPPRTRSRRLAPLSPRQYYSLFPLCSASWNAKGYL